MRLFKMFGLTALGVVAAMASIGATSASALKHTELCTVHWELDCLASGANLVHLVLEEGTVGKVLTTLAPVLCLYALVDASALSLAKPQNIHVLTSEYTGCGTNSTHNNCGVTVEEQPLGTLLKTGLDEGSVTLTSGRSRLVCSNLGLDCKYDNEATLFEVGAQHLIANNAEVTELGGKFFCPNWLEIDGSLETLEETYVLG